MIIKSKKEIKKKVMSANDINNISSNSIYNKPIFYTELEGGLGNQLFMIFNLISLSYDKKVDFNIYYKYIPHKYPYEYELFKNIKFQKFSNYDLIHFITFYEKEYRYNKTKLDYNRSYILSGYYQSYKYFWHNINEIKKYLYINYDLINEIKTKYLTFNKKILSIHIRLKDYVEFNDYHCISPITFYEDCLKKYVLKDYQIILFSDDMHQAELYIKSLNLDFIRATDFSFNDEYQFYMLCLSDVKICSNSTYVLMSCYFNEIYNFIENAEYYFYYKWFENGGPKFNIFDLIPSDNDNFKIILERKKCAVIFFHKNIYKIYDKCWIDKCIDSVLDQKNVIFDIFEVNYGNESESILKDKNLKDIKNYFFVKDYKTHAEAMIFLLNKIFNELKYDIVFNTNLDDYYEKQRFSYQLFDIILNKNLLNSSLWIYIDENNKLINSPNAFFFKDNDISCLKINDKNELININENENIKINVIKNNLSKKNNIINHSGVCFTSQFWNCLDKFGNYLRYRDDLPFEDLALWIRAINNEVKIGIINKHLINYRIHNKQVGNLNNIHKDEKNITFKKGIDNTNVRLGLLVKLIDNNVFENFLSEIDYLKNKYSYFFIYLNENLEKQFNDNIDKFERYSIIKYKNEIDNNSIIKKFDVKIDIQCDNLHIYNENREIIFYTCYYKIKSKFDNIIYIDWAKKFYDLLKPYKVVIFTNNETLDELNKYFTLKDYPNFEYRIKEFKDFELYDYLEDLKLNGSKIYFPNYDISTELILLWINRHLFLKEVKEMYNNYNFYSYIDIGYFRYDLSSDFIINIDYLNANKIYLNLYNNKLNDLKEFYNFIKNKSDVSNYIMNNYIGGGGYIVGKNVIDKWLDYYNKTLRHFLNNKILFKDDQILLSYTIFNNIEEKSLIFVSNINNNELWFPLISFLKNYFDKNLLYKNIYNLLDF